MHQLWGNSHGASTRSAEVRSEEVKRVGNTLQASESSLTEAERDVIVECARELEVSKEAKLQEVFISIGMEGGNNPVLTMRAISTCN
jgi:hypothetical protein